MKNRDIKKIIREMIEKENEARLKKELQTRIMDNFRKVAVPFTDEANERPLKQIINGLEDTLISFKKDNDIQ